MIIDVDSVSMARFLELGLKYPHWNETKVSPSNVSMARFLELGLKFQVPLTEYRCLRVIFLEFELKYIHCSLH